MSEPLPADADESDDLTHADIGIVHATPIEISPFLDRCDRVRKYTGGDLVFRGARFGAIRIAFAQCGMGFEPARRATQALIDGHSPKWIVSAGFSGALRPEMRVGDIVVANEIVSPHGQQLTLDMNMEPDPAKGRFVGKLLTVDQIIRTVAEKKQLGDTFGALAIDMESLAVAQMCRDTKTRCLAVRVISDDMSADLPPEILTILGSTGSLRLGAALGAVWKRPGSIKEMWRLRELAQVAGDRLATFLEGIIVQLYEAQH